MSVVERTHATVRRDSNTQTIYFNTYEQEEQYAKEVEERDPQDWYVYQYWIDDPVLLRQKFAWAKQQRLGGVGPFVFRNLDPIHQPELSREMWSTFDAFLFPESPVELPEEASPLRDHAKEDVSEDPTMMW